MLKSVFPSRPLAVKIRKAGHDRLLAGVQGIAGGGGLKVEPDNHGVIARWPKSLNGGIAQTRVVQLMPDGINVGGLGEFDVHQRAAAEVNAVNQSVMNYHGNNPGQRQSQGKGDEVPLDSHPVNLWFVKKLHGPPSNLSSGIDTATTREVPKFCCSLHSDLKAAKASDLGALHSVLSPNVKPSRCFHEPHGCD